MTQSIINTGKVLHQAVIGQLQGIAEEYFDKQPEGFNNTIRWNIGHIIYWMDKYSTLSFGTPSVIPDSYETLFNSGTKPLDWKFAPPSKEELVEMLTTQLSRLSELTPEMLEEKLSAPYAFGPFTFNTAGELFNFALIHEAIHLGTISSQLRLTNKHVVPSRTAEVFGAFRRAFETGDTADFLNKVMEDFRFLVPLPLEGWNHEQQGKERFEDLIRFERSVLQVQLTPLTVLENENNGVVVFRAEGSLNGRPYLNELAVVFEYEAERICSFREYVGMPLKNYETP